MQILVITFKISYNDDMKILDFKHLKSGTDVRGTAVGETVTLTDEAVTAITRAFIVWLNNRQSLKSPWGTTAEFLPSAF